MRRVTFGSTSCYCSGLAVLGLALMIVSKLVIKFTPPSGTGDMTGMNHLGWGITILALVFAVPSLSVIGFLMGSIGTIRAKSDLPLAKWGVTLNGLALALSSLTIPWAFP